MSEYWKSTPRYWCKHCSTYVRDTKVEKQNHEATGRHQGNLKRFLRDIHKNSEKEEREKQRAQKEVQRLNGIVTGSSPLVAQESQRSETKSVAKSSIQPRQATAADRKLQIAQLAELGVAIPDEFRAEMAIAGEWQAVAPQRGSDNTEEVGLNGQSIGVRKRRLSNEEVEGNPNDGSQIQKRRRWGTSLKAYPEAEQEDPNLEALLGIPISLNSKVGRDSMNKLSGSPHSRKQESPPPDSLDSSNVVIEGPLDDSTLIKKEDDDDKSKLLSLPSDIQNKLSAPVDPGGNIEPVIFKKRKKKSMKQQ
ncbi:MAG: hypothetical protein M1814_003055 [Vezdaea aestivalis]|nr:MAG: hypothetical protein M1814_003055 [Vezdaea aestivalis]